MPDVTYNEDHYDYTLPDAADPDSELPLTLDADTVEEDTPTPVTNELGGSLADMLRAEVGKRTVPTITVRVPGREGWTMRFRLDWSESQSNEWEKAAQDRTRANGLNMSKLFRRTIADQCIALLKDGQVVPGYGAKPFQSKELQRDFKASSASGAVEVWLPIFPQLQSVATAIAKAAQQESLLDPTDPD